MGLNIESLDLNLTCPYCNTRLILHSTLFSTLWVCPNCATVPHFQPVDMQTLSSVKPAYQNTKLNGRRKGFKRGKVYMIALQLLKNPQLLKMTWKKRLQFFNTSESTLYRAMKLYEECLKNPEKAILVEYRYNAFYKRTPH